MKYIIVILLFLTLCLESHAQLLDQKAIYIVVLPSSKRDGDFQYFKSAVRDKNEFRFSWPIKPDYKTLLMVKDKDSVLIKRGDKLIGRTTGIKFVSEKRGQILNDLEYKEFFRNYTNVIFSPEFVLFDFDNLDRSLRNNPVYIIIPLEDVANIMYEVAVKDR